MLFNSLPLTMLIGLQFYIRDSSRNIIETIFSDIFLNLLNGK